MPRKLHETSIQYVKGVGPAKKKLFDNLGVQTVEDLMYFFPRRYEDRRVMVPIAQAQVGETQTVCGKVISHQARKSWHTKKHVFEAVIDDGSGRLALTWFNQPYLVNYFRPGKRVVCYGKVDIYKNRLQMVSPEYEVMDDKDDTSLSLKRIVPIYPLTRGITQRYLRKIVKSVLDQWSEQLRDELPVELRNKHRLANIRRSIQQVHFPEDFEHQEEALKRISFEEFYFFQLSIILRRLSIVQKDGIIHQLPDADALAFTHGFPFELTSAQMKVVRDMREDMLKPHPMLRLIQGDVGSGKTVVALFGCYNAIKCGHQAAFMAPTEILARQHFENIKKLTEDGPLKGMKAALLISALKKKEREALLAQIASGEVDLIVGTHALISEDVQFKKLSFVVIDEQHKFGVRQRALMSEKGKNPDVLIMTATPIPRTLCITLYGDMDVSIIDEFPKGRGKITTEQFSHEAAKDAYAHVVKKVQEGRQAYIVYPIIEESESMDLKAAEASFKQFKKGVFKNFRVELVHGRLKREETENIMQRFKNHEIDILVATTVLEVGVDVANASVMVIEHAERFGLAQLHQLRGRIGRGEHNSECLLICDPVTDEGQARIEAVLESIDGFKIAQQDLLIRGPGRYFGRHQHGLNELKVANPTTQLDILELARKEALALIKEDPTLSQADHQAIKRVILSRYPTYLSMVSAG